ncbi:unnamed protein product [Dicrocoelium dendriticum]|nr:unnamed protein product [Dicrocoelium dendriticum]
MLRFGKSPGISEFQIVTTGVDEKRKKSGKKFSKRKDLSTEPNFKKPTLQPVWTDDEDYVPTEYVRPPPIFDINSYVSNRHDGTTDTDFDNPEYGRQLTAVSNILREDDSGHLPQSKAINIRRVFDVNRERVSMGAIVSVHFNPVCQMCLTGSADSTLAFFKVDGTENALLRDRVFENYPLSSAKFTPSGERVVFTGNRNSFRIYDLQSGEETRASPFIGSSVDDLLVQCELSSGQPNIVALGTTNRTIYLADLRSLEKVSTLSTKAPLRSFCFLDSGAFLTTIDASGSVFVFDLRNRRPRVVHQWIDQACTAGTAIASSSDGRWIACGSDCGYTNVYQCSKTMQSCTPEPDKSIANLQTAVDTIAFHPASEMLCLSSSQRSASIRLYHLHGRHVFDNFPVRTGQLSSPTSVAFSPNGGYLCVGQSNGRAALYHILHYMNY